MATLAKLELDAQDLEQEVRAFLQQGATVNLFSRSSGSGEKNHMSYDSTYLERFSVEEIVQALRNRAKLYWDEASHTNKVAEHYLRMPRGRINHYIKVLGKEPK